MYTLFTLIYKGAATMQHSNGQDNDNARNHSVTEITGIGVLVAIMPSETLLELMDLLLLDHRFDSLHDELLSLRAELFNELTNSLMSGANRLI